MKRVLAVAAALGMIGLSLFARGRLDDDGSSAPDSDPPSSEDVLICDIALEPACNDLGVTVWYEEAAGAASALEDGTARWWLTTSAAAEVARSDVGLGPSSNVIARSPVVMVIWNEDVVDGCEWKCLVERDLPLGVPRPDVLQGTPVVGGGAADFFDDGTFARNDFDLVDGFDLFLGALVPERDPLASMLQLGRGRFVAVGLTEAEAVARLRTAAKRGEVRLIYPSPMVTADLVLVAGSGSPPEDLADDSALLAGLAALGWRVEGQQLAEGLDTGLVLPAVDDGPSPGALAALRERYEAAQ